MTTDRYTKVVLTIIAISLATIALQHTIPSAFAQSSAMRVVLCDTDALYRCANLSRDGALKVTTN
jgi:hypothetical protein